MTSLHKLLTVPSLSRLNLHLNGIVYIQKITCNLLSYHSECYNTVGFVFHWALMLLAEFWVLHLIHLFLKIAFPMWSRKLDRKKIKFILHVIEVAGAIFLCSIAPTLFVIFSKYQFGRLPPLICNPSKEVSFYTICLPLCIIMGFGMILAIIMFWILHKVSSINT